MKLSRQDLAELIKYLNSCMKNMQGVKERDRVKAFLMLDKLKSLSEHLQIKLLRAVHCNQRTVKVQLSDTHFIVLSVMFRRYPWHLIEFESMIVSKIPADLIPILCEK